MYVFSIYAFEFAFGYNILSKADWLKDQNAHFVTSEFNLNYLQSSISWLFLSLVLFGRLAEILIYTGDTGNCKS